MKKIRLISLGLAGTLLFGSVCSFANSFDSLDQKSANAGAAAALKHFYQQNSNADQIISEALAPIIAINTENDNLAGDEKPETLPEELYENEKIGIVCTSGILNVRKRPSTLAETVAQVQSGEEIYVIGQRMVNGNLWYKVKLVDGEGYAFAKYVLFGIEAEAFMEELYEARKKEAVMPKSAVLLDDIKNLSEKAKEKLDKYIKIINYSLKYDYPKAVEEEKYINEYAILVYLIENYQSFRDLAEECRMNETAAQARTDLFQLQLILENLQDTTGQSEGDFQKQIEKAQEERRKKDQLSFGEMIAEYAATFVGILPYVWGGASLTTGADCSGFCQQIYAHFGLMNQWEADMHAYDSYALRYVGRSINISDIQPGDMVCYSGHVAIYYGNGMVVHEPSRGKKAEFGNVYMMPIITIRRLQGE